MAGCINKGIASITVKAPNGKDSILFNSLLNEYNNNIDLAYEQYLKANTKRVIELAGNAEKDENGEYLFLSVSSFLDSVGIYYSTFQQSSNSILPKLEIEAKKYSLEKNEQGVENNFYTDTTTNSIMSRASNAISKFMVREFEKLSGKELTDSLIDSDVAYKFRNVLKGVEISIQGTLFTEDSYREFKKSIFERGRVKGNLIHTLLQLQTARLLENTELVKELEIQVENLKLETSLRKDAYDWVTENKNYKKILTFLGVESKTTKDNKLALSHNIQSELVVGSSILGIVGKIDTLLEASNGVIQVVDYKTGNLEDDNLSRVFRYGDQTDLILDNAINRARLQAMIYSLIIKVENPSAYLKPPLVLNLVNEQRLNNPTTLKETNVRAFLKMIETYYKNDEPEVYKKIMANSPNSFNPAHYGTSAKVDFSQELIDAQSKTHLELLEGYKQELSRLRYQANSVGSTLGNKDRIQDLVKLIIEGESSIQLPTNFSNVEGISALSLWLGASYDQRDPYIQAYTQTLNKVTLAKMAEEKKLFNKFDSLLAKAYGEKSTNAVNKSFVPVDKQEYFKRFYNVQIQEDKQGQRKILTGLIKDGDADWAKLTKSEKELVTFIRTNLQDVWQDVMVSGPNSVAYQTAAGRDVTKENVFNENNKVDFNYSDRFFPAIMKDSSDLNWEALKLGVVGVGKWVKDKFHRVLTNFTELYETDQNQKQFGIPVKFTSNYNSEVHSLNLERGFKMYMSQMLTKKHLDNVYVLGDSLSGLMQLQDTNKEAAQRAGRFLGHVLEIAGGGDDVKQEELNTRGLILYYTKENYPVRLNLSKFARALSSGIAGAALWLNVKASSINAIAAVFTVVKEDLVNKIASQKWTGISVSELSLKSQSENAYKTWFGSISDSKNAYDSHPVNVFLEQFNLLPDAPELSSRKDSFIVDGGEALDIQKFLYSVYTIPENATTAIAALNAIMGMEIVSGKYAGKSMWEVYSKSVKINPDTGKGYFELPTDFTRGYEKNADGSLSPVSGLTSKEYGKIKALIYDVKSGYGISEKTYLQASNPIFGSFILLFKRFLPQLLVRGFKTGYDSQSRGNYTLDEQGLYVWEPLKTEGKWITVYNAMIHLFGKKGKDSYAWADMSTEQKRNILDAGVTLAFFTSIMGTLSILFSGADDDDETLKYFTNINNRLLDQWNVYEWVKMTTQTPAAVDRSLKLLKAFKDISGAAVASATGGEEDLIYTNKGDIRGANTILSQFAIYDTYNYFTEE